MNGSTFTTSPIERERRRNAGPALTLVTGTGGAPTIERDPPRRHPAFEGFTPDGTPGPIPVRPVRVSEPGSPTLHRTSRGSASPDREGTASPGSGPIDRRSLVIDRLARLLDDHRGGPTASEGPAARTR